MWDYRFSEAERKQEFFRQWYVTRVLTRGGIKDVRGVGLQTVHDDLPRLFLPKKIHAFWEWFFSLPEIRKRYGHLDTLPPL